MSMQGAGEITGLQLMAEIGDVRRFTHKGALVPFAGVDAPPFRSGEFESKPKRVSKRGSPHLRKVLFLISSVILKRGDPRKQGLSVHGQKARGRQAFLRLYGCRFGQISPYLLRAGESLLERRRY